MTKKLKYKLYFFIKFFISIILCCNVTSCNTNENGSKKEVIFPNNCDSNIIPYRNDISISDSNGKMKNINYMLPMDLYPLFDSIGDTIFCNLNVIYEVNFNNSPVLYNFFLGADIYRITTISDWTGFQLSYVITKNKNGIYLYVNQINLAYNYILKCTYGNKADNLPWSYYRDSMKLSNKDWKVFNEIFNKSRFYCFPNKFNAGKALDAGAEIFEAHTKKGYYLVERTGFCYPMSDDLKRFNELLNFIALKSKQISDKFMIINHFILAKHNFKKNLNYYKDYKLSYLIKPEAIFNSDFSSKNILYKKIYEYNAMTDVYNKLTSENVKKIYIKRVLQKMDEIIELIKPYENKILITRSILDY